MKNSLLAAVVAVSLAAAALPAIASVTQTPTISLVAGPASTVGVEGMKAGCASPARIDGTPYWEMPAIAAEQGVAGTTQIKIDLSPSGALLRESLFSSSGSAVLDGAALRSPRMTRFSAAVVDCNRVAGSYLYVVVF